MLNYRSVSLDSKNVAILTKKLLSKSIFGLQSLGKVEFLLDFWAPQKTHQGDDAWLDGGWTNPFEKY